MDYKKLFDEIKRQSIMINCEEQVEKISLAKSKIGGKPYLPKDFQWPYFEGEDFNDETKNRPLSFMAQINLEEVQEFDKDELLPKKGMLYFFYELATMTWGFDPKDKGSAKVYYYEDLSGFCELDYPTDMEEDYVPELAISFENKINIPCYEELYDYVDNIDWDEYEEASALNGYELADESYHKLLGYADLIQGSMLLECEKVTNGIYCGGIDETEPSKRAELLEASKDWTLLLQLSTIESENNEIMFGDCGNIYFYIKKADLKEKNFDNVWLISQCY